MKNGVALRSNAMGTFLRTSVSVAALFLAGTGYAVAGDPMSITAMSTASAQPGMAAAHLNETNRYYLHLITEIFDGSKNFSHAQVAAFARIRSGNESWSMVDYGDGAVVFEKPDGLAASQFQNTSTAELAFHYNYDTKTIAGDSNVARFHNNYVRPQLDRGPELGKNARWTAEMPLSAIGMGRLSGGPVSIELTREYFSHQGTDYVLVNYRVPSFRYNDRTGKTVVHWAQGMTLTDPGFGKVYLNAALHRAVAREDGQPRPYRFSRTMVAADKNGQPLIDPRKIPSVARYYDDFYSPESTQVISFSGSGDDLVDQTPIRVASNLDVMALSLGENSANQAPELAGAQSNEPRGEEKSTGQKVMDGVSNAATLNTLSGVVLTWAGVKAGTPEEAQMIKAVEAKVKQVYTSGEALKTELTTAQKNLELAETALKNAPIEASSWKLKPAYANVESDMVSAGKAFQAASDELNNTYNYLLGEGRNLPLAERKAIRAAATSKFNQAQWANDNAIALFEDVAQDPKSYDFVPAARDQTLVRNYEKAAEEVLSKEAKLAQYTEQAVETVQDVKNIPKGSWGNYIKAVQEGPIGKTLTGLSHTFNGITGLTAVYNVGSQTGDLSGGEVNLTRSYGSKGAVALLGLDLLSLAGNALTLNAKGFWSDAAAITVGSVTDVYLSIKGLKNVNEAVTRAAQETTRLEKMKTEQIIRKQQEWEDEVAQLDKEIGEIDKENEKKQKLAEDMLEERRKAREELKRQQEEEERQQQAEEDRQEKRKKEQEYADGANERLEDAMKPDYPTAPPRTPKDDKPSDDPQYSEIPDWLKKQWEEDEKRRKNAEELKRIQDALLAKKKADEANRDPMGKPFKVSELETTPLEISELKVSKFDIDAVKFDMPKFDPPKFDPPKFVPPEFDGPSTSDLDLRSFDEDSWMNDVNNPALKNMDLSDFKVGGIAETDLSPWEDWLKTQNVRQLERWALDAGFPNLASALARATYLISLVRDEGWRKWAMSPPPCHGYSGCTTYWADLQRRSALLALGDVLNESRDIFSTGGFSDIGISSQQLAYLLRDNGVEDNDIVDIEIRQFGRPIYNSRVVLTNAGEDFDIGLRRGVASLIITAVNEGQFSPNTAQIRVDDVVRGEGLQSYSLSTGESATLRIEANATAQGN